MPLDEQLAQEFSVCAFLKVPGHFEMIIHSKEALRKVWFEMLGVLQGGPLVCRLFNKTVPFVSASSANTTIHACYRLTAAASFNCRKASLKHFLKSRLTEVLNFEKSLFFLATRENAIV